MRQFLQNLLKQPVQNFAKKHSSRPNKERIYEALTQLRTSIQTEPGKKGEIIDACNKKFIIFSDHHKGAKDGADDFVNCEANYLAALDHYEQQNYHLVILGDGEELWENSLDDVIKNNPLSIEREKRFVATGAYTKIFGNHDLYWDNDPFASQQHEKLFGKKIPIYEGLLLTMNMEGKDLQIFLTHGHQGDLISDGNALSKWFISRLWAPFQSYLEINPNTPAYDNDLKTEHNLLMYGWSAKQPDLLLITGHTHQPVFESLTYLERLYRLLAIAQQRNNSAEIHRLEEEIAKRRVQGEYIPDFTAYQPCYFNSGCCCFSDGDITGIEIENGVIRLIKWKTNNQLPVRLLLEEIEINRCIMQPVIEQQTP